MPSRLAVGQLIMGTESSKGHGFRGTTVGLILNPRAGGYRDVPAAEDLVRMLQEQGLDVLPTLVNARADPADAARIALAQGAQILVAAGGDGTVSAVASASWTPTLPSVFSRLALSIILPGICRSPSPSRRRFALWQQDNSSTSMWAR